MKTLVSAIASGIRPLSIKASLQSWLGVPITLKDGDFWREFGGSGSFTGKRVTVYQALQLATVWACVRLIAETLATLPLGFYQRKADGSRDPATSHGLYEILHNQPNADMTAVVFWEVVVASMLLWGNAYVEIIRSGNTIVALHFLLPVCMKVRRLAGGAYEYRYLEPTTGKERPISEADLMHIPAFSTDGVFGLSPIAYGANVFGTSIETDRASAETFRDAMRSPGLITMDMLLKKDQREEIRTHVKSVSDSGGVMVLEKGTGFQKLGFDPVSAELLSSRSWNVEEMCRWYRVDPAMIGHGNKDSNWGTGLEQKMLWFLTFTLRQWCVRIEQAVRKSLLTPVERMRYWAEFNMEGLLRSDSASRSTFLGFMVDHGLMTRDEARAKENLAPMGGNAAVLTVQSAMIAIDDMKAGTNASVDVQNTLNATLDDLRFQIMALAAQPRHVEPAPIFNVDARTTVAAAPAPNVTVNIPEQQAAPINVDARTTVNPSPAPNVIVNVPEHKAPDVRVDVAAPIVNVAPVQLELKIERDGQVSTTTYARDPETKEIMSSTTIKE